MSRGLMAAGLAALLGLSMPTHPAQALETIDFNAPDASESLMETLRASSLLLTAQAADRTAPLDLMAAARAEYGRLIGLLYEEAYFAPTIHVRVDGREAADIPPLSNPSQIDRIAVDIALGPQFTFAEVSVSPLIPGTVLPEGFAPGQPARSTTVRAALNAALDAWRAQGYALAAAADQRVVANHNANQLNVRLTLTPGPQLRIGTVVPQGQERTRPQRIVDIAGLERGAIHNPEDITDAETRLRQTGAFASVVLNTGQTANPDGTVDVTALVEEAPLRRLGFGAEIDSQSGLELSGFWLHRNLTGGADRLRLEATVDGIAAQDGGLGYSLDARYIRPATLDRDTDLELGLNAVRLNERDYEADAFQADATLIRRYTDALQASAGVILRFESADFSGTTGDFGTFGVPITITHDTRDVTLNATDGHYIWAEAMPYLGFAEAQSGLRLRFDARTYHDMGSEGRFVLAGRAQLGAVVGPDIDATPRGYLFYSGGGGTVRGLPYQSLGVFDPSGTTRTGGLSFAGLSAELRMRVNDSFSLVAFADAGAVSAGVFTGATGWQAGGGLGIRYATPIGPLRLDLATPIRRNAGVTGSSVQLYLGIGQAF